MCGLRNLAMHDYKESVTTDQTDTRTDGQTDARQNDPYVLLCFEGDTKNGIDRHTRSSYIDLTNYLRFTT